MLELNELYVKQKAGTTTFIKYNIGRTALHCNHIHLTCVVNNLLNIFNIHAMTIPENT